MWLHSLKVAQLLRSAACLHTSVPVIFEPPCTLCCYSGVYFLLTLFFYYFFGSFFFILVIHCVVFLVTNFSVVFYYFFDLFIVSPLLLSHIYFCHWLKSDKLRNITSDVQRLLEISLLATLLHFFSLTCPSFVTNIFNVSLTFWSRNFTFKF